MQWPPQRQIRKDVFRENSLREASSLVLDQFRNIKIQLDSEA